MFLGDLKAHKISERQRLEWGTRVSYFQTAFGSATNSVQDCSYVSLCFSFSIHLVKILLSSANRGAHGVLIHAYQIHGNLPAELALQGQPLEPLSGHMLDLANLVELQLWQTLGHKMGWPVLPCLQTSAALSSTFRMPGNPPGIETALPPH